MPTPETSFISQLRTKILPNVHRIALILSGLGLGLLTLQYTGATELLMIGLSTLAGVYFLMAFMMIQLPPNCKPNLYSFMLYKLIYITSAVTVIGVLFALLKLPGADQMLLIGCGGLGVSILFSAVLIGSNRDNMVVLKSPFLRGLGLLFLGVYFMYQLSMF